mmetsp:Transcript_101255/g.325388  ORF Transcript_101255/g.325388 Transcript_101255/m.325388 type:complete len:302 (+) Transcript_101255:500-1405(+)
MPSSTSSATNRRFGSRATSRAGALGTRTARSRPRQLGVRTRACSTTSTRTETARSCIRRQTTHSRPRCSGAAIAWTSRRRPSGSGPRARRETRVPRPRAPAWPDPRPLLLLRGGLPHPQFLCWLLRWGPVRKRQQLRSRRKFTMLLGSSCTGTTRRTTRRRRGSWCRLCRISRDRTPSTSISIPLGRRILSAATMVACTVHRARTRRSQRLLALPAFLTTRASLAALDPTRCLNSGTKSTRGICSRAPCSKFPRPQQAFRFRRAACSSRPRPGATPWGSLASRPSRPCRAWGLCRRPCPRA